MSSEAPIPSWSSLPSPAQARQQAEANVSVWKCARGNAEWNAAARMGHWCLLMSFLMFLDGFWMLWDLISWEPIDQKKPLPDRRCARSFPRRSSCRCTKRPFGLNGQKKKESLEQRVINDRESIGYDISYRINPIWYIYIERYNPILLSFFFG